MASANPSVPFGTELSTPDADEVQNAADGVAGVLAGDGTLTSLQRTSSPPRSRR